MYFDVLYFMIFSWRKLTVIFFSGYEVFVLRAKGVQYAYDNLESYLYEWIQEHLCCFIVNKIDSL